MREGLKKFLIVAGTVLASGVVAVSASAFSSVTAVATDDEVPQSGADDEVIVRKETSAMMEEYPVSYSEPIEEPVLVEESSKIVDNWKTDLSDRHKHSFGVTGSFIDWGNNGDEDVVMTDKNVDGIYTADIHIDNVTSDMISHQTTDSSNGDWTETGKVGIQFKVRMDNSWNENWSEYEYIYDRTSNSQTNMCFYAEPGDTIDLTVCLDTTRQDEAAWIIHQMDGSIGEVADDEVYRYWPVGFSVRRNGAASEVYNYPDENSNITYTLTNGVLTIKGKGSMQGKYLVSPFKNNTGIKKVVISKGITDISVGAFYGCTNLTSVTIPDTVTNIGFGAFAGCTKLKTIPLPPSLSQISQFAFSGCTAMTEIQIPAGLKKIDHGLFYNCSSLGSVTIPEGTEIIADNAFSGCTNLSSVSLPEGIERIGYKAFSGCTSLSSVSLPKTFGLIDEYAFSGCTALRSIKIPAGTGTIVNMAFYDCTNLSDITLAGTDVIISSSAFHNTAWYNAQPDGPVYLGKYLYSMYKGTIPQNTSVVIKDGTVKILNSILRKGSFPLYGDRYENIVSITFPGSITSIPDGLCREYVDLKKVVMKSGVKEIGHSTFKDCKLLSSVTIPGTVEKIGNSAFENCSSLTTITIPGTVESIGASAFENCSSLASVNMQSGLKNIGVCTFSGCTSLTTITIPGTVESIGAYAFAECSSLTSVNMQSGLKNIGVSTFSVCTSLTTITIPGTVESIGARAFTECTSLSSITIPDSVISIGSWAFRHTKWLDDQPTGFVYLGKVLYGYHVKKENVEYGYERPIEVVPYYSMRINGKNYVMEAASNSDEIPENTVLVIKSGTKGIAEAALMNTNIAGVTFPASITNIGNYAFIDCQKLREVNIPSGTKKIGDFAFCLCPALTDVYVPNSVTEMGKCVFGENADSFAICGVKGSYAETYAADYKIPFYDGIRNCASVNSALLSLGSRIYISGSAKFGSGSYTYSYYYKRTSAKVWKLIGTENTSSGMAFFTPRAVGDFDIKVVAKDSSGKSQEMVTKVSIVDGNAENFVNNSWISVSKAKPNTRIYINGNAAGSGKYKYAFYYKRTTSSVWKAIGEEFGSTASASFKPKSAGEFRIKVDIIDKNGKLVSKLMSLSISDDAPDVPTNKSTISYAYVTLGNRLTIKGAASGGAGGYKYTYQQKKSTASKWHTIGSENTNDTVAYFKPSAKGRYDVRVIVTDKAGVQQERTFVIVVK